MGPYWPRSRNKLSTVQVYAISGLHGFMSVMFAGATIVVASSIYYTPCFFYIFINKNGKFID